MSDERQDPPDQIAQIRQREQDVIRLLRARSSWYRNGCPHLEDHDSYIQDALAVEAADDLDMALAELDRLQRERDEAVYVASTSELTRAELVHRQGATVAAIRGDALAEFDLSFPEVREADDLRRAKDAAEQEIARLSKEVAICQSQRAHAEAANQGLRAQVRELTTLQKQSGDTIEKQAVENDRLADTIDGLRAQVAEQGQPYVDRLRTQALEIEEALRSSGIGSGTLPNGVRKLAMELAEAEQARDEAMRAWDAENEKRRDAEEQLTALREALTKIANAARGEPYSEFAVRVQRSAEAALADVQPETGDKG